MYFLEHIKDRMFKPFIVMLLDKERRVSQIERFTLTIQIHEVGRDQ